MTHSSAEDRIVSDFARRSGFSESGVREALAALQKGGGRAAQFAHAEFGGAGQWMPGMTMIGDMFNWQLRTRVDALFTELAATLHGQPANAEDLVSLRWPTPSVSGEWYSRELGIPSFVGEQNGVRYAFFPETARLAIQIDGRLTVYDTADHRIHSVQASQSDRSGTLTFTSQHGTVNVSALRVVK